MIPPVRREILERLVRLSELAPDVRFGQMIANLAFMVAGPWDETLWELTDDQLLAAIQQHITELSARSEEKLTVGAGRSTPAD